MDTRARILDFLNAIGIPVVVEPVADPAFLPGLKVRDGALVHDPERNEWAGDLLHEAGHIAVTEPALRRALCEVSSEPHEEMAAIAWSYAAACAIELDPAIVFHAGGYGGGSNGGAWLIEAFRNGGVGVPMLVWYGMARDPKEPAGYPRMVRWLR